MGRSLTEEDIRKISYGNYKKIKNFVETGTYMGETTRLASRYYDSVFSIEINPLLHEKTCSVFKMEGIKNVKLFLGDSIVILDEIIPDVLDGAVFFLDAHISGSDSDWNKKQRVPLLEELDCILKYKLKPSVFILDDVRFWKGHSEQAWDWNHITSGEILNIFHKNNYKIGSFYEESDRFYVMTV
jgi:hypothetical protein